MTTKLGKTSVVCRAVGAAVLVLGGLLPLSAEAQWALVARHVIGRVHQVTQQRHSAFLALYLINSSAYCIQLCLLLQKNSGQRSLEANHS